MKRRDFIGALATGVFVSNLLPTQQGATVARSHVLPSHRVSLRPICWERAEDRAPLRRGSGIGEV